MFRTHPALPFALGAIGFVCALASAAAPQLGMNVEPGLWEVTFVGDPAGAPALPDSLLQKLTPEQQAKMQQVMARASQPKKFKECMTADKLSRGFGSKSEDSDDCKVSVTINTSTQYQAERQCSAQGGNVQAKLHFNIMGKRQASGTVDLTLTQPDGKVLSTHRTMQAQWLSSDCGNVKNIELEK